MKRLTIVLWIFSNYCFSQKPEVFRIDSIPQQGILLDKGWKWHAGDNPDFAKVDFDDSTWESIDPTLDIRDSISERVKKQVGILRLYLSLHSSLKNVPLSIQIQHSVAAQYYLNGIKIAESGTISTNPQYVKAKDLYWRPIVFSLKTDSVNILEVRFASQPDILYTTVFETRNPLTSIRVNEANRSQSLYSDFFRRYGMFIFFLIGMSIMIFVLHTSLYFLYPENKANLYFALSRLIYATGVLLQITCLFHTSEIGHKYWYGSFAFALLTLSNFFTLLSVLYYLNRKIDWIDKIYFVFLIPVLYAVFFIYPNGWLIAPFYQFALTFNLIRVAILSRKKNKIDSIVIGLGSLVTFICFVLFIYVGTFNIGDFVTTLPPYRMVLYLIYALAIPVAISIFIAKEFANIALNLKKKLIEVETLSTEKQHILSTQNETLELQVVERTAELRASQDQLIQKEKLAFLGELTAGIAHEIQNPLNFVNNFSEVSVELLGDLKEIRHKGTETQRSKEEDEIFDDISQNLEKITLHGKRASSIVKGMLEHSKASSGEKELTDINALADEYLRLSYHGLRAKDKDFNSDFKTDFDPNVPKVNIIPQDIGRVLLNLINNAFYAAHESKKTNPMVTVTTKLIPSLEGQGWVSITVKDNGNGIPKANLEKIFQPFFTTKPTGQGTGLGLSLAYDIVTKGHGGTIEVVSKEGEGAEFIVKIPI